jgi:hypothetical protein
MEFDVGGLREDDLDCCYCGQCPECKECKRFGIIAWVGIAAILGAVIITKF